MTEHASNTVLTEWQNALGALMTEVRQWCEAQGWEVQQFDKEIREEALGSYVAPMLGIVVGPRQLWVEPVARQVVGGEGRVEILIMPSLDHFTLVRKQGQWHVYDTNIVNIGVLDGVRFVNLIQELSRAA